MTATERPNRQQERVRESRAALIAAARASFLDNGYAGTSVGGIAKRAGRAHGTFYLHFQSKAEILTVLLDEIWLDLREQSRAAWNADEPEASVHATVGWFVSSFAREAELWRLFEEVSTTDPAFRAEWDAHYSTFVNGVLRGLESSGNPVDLDGLHHRLVAETLAAMLYETCSVCFLHGRSWSVDEVTNHVATLWIRMLR